MQHHYKRMFVVIAVRNIHHMDSKVENYLRLRKEIDQLKVEIRGYQHLIGLHREQANEHTEKADQMYTKIIQLNERMQKLSYEQLQYTTEPEEVEEPQPVYFWNLFLISDANTHPKQVGKYLVQRKDGKHHFEMWNGSGWAYNHKEIVSYALVKPFDKKRKSCEVACSPSDYYKGGKCDLNGCYKNG